MRIGILALQGDFREHYLALKRCGVTPHYVRREAEIESLDALVIPGGESTAIAHLAQVCGVFDVITAKIANGMPTYGSCAGMILVADRILDAAPGQRTFGGLDVTVRRNAFGRQVDSFEADLSFNNRDVHAVFIRAPWVEEVGSGVEILSTVHTQSGTHPVAIRNRHILATSFHPELTEDSAVHRYFLENVVR